MNEASNNMNSVSAKKISLFIDGHSFDKEYQGTHGFIRGLYESLSKKYHNLDIYAGANDKENLQKELSENIKKMAKPNATKDIVEQIVKLLK